MKCHRAKEQTIDETVGNTEDSFVNLESYFEPLKTTNPETVTAIETELDIEGHTRFLFAFLFLVLQFTVSVVFALFLLLMGHIYRVNNSKIISGPHLPFHCPVTVHSHLVSETIFHLSRSTCI